MIPTNQNTVSGWIWTNESAPLWTWVYWAQGAADTKLMSQIFRMVFLAWPGLDLASGERGWHIARYLENIGI